LRPKERTETDLNRGRCRERKRQVVFLRAGGGKEVGGEIWTTERKSIGEEHILCLEDQEKVKHFGGGVVRKNKSMGEGTDKASCEEKGLN